MRSSLASGGRKAATGRAAAAASMASAATRPVGPGELAGRFGNQALLRKCAACEEDGAGAVRRQADTAQISDGTNAPPSVHDVLRTPGRPMDAATHGFMARRFGADLSHVRIHTDADAARSARDLNAQAYTVGSHIVFAQGRYDPAGDGGRRLIAHELAHAVQQGGGLRRAPDTGALGKLPDADRQALTFDKDAVDADPKKFFGLKGEIVLATNVTEDFDIQAPTIDALKDDKVKSALWKGLKAYARGLFELVPGEDGKASAPLLNRVKVVNLDLTAWSGPNTAFRFTIRGKSAGGKITANILIEALDQLTKPMADDATTMKATEALAAKYGLTRDTTFPDSVWKRILAALGKIPDALLSKIHDVVFDTSAQDVGPTGEAAEFSWTFAGGKWGRKIVVYDKGVKAKDAEFAFLMAHEIAHAIDHAPAEGATGAAAGKDAHNDKAFQDAEKKDGGRSKAVTDYAKTDDKEYYAENFAMFIQQPAVLKALRPNIYAYFEALQGAGAAKP